MAAHEDFNELIDRHLSETLTLLLNIEKPTEFAPENATPEEKTAWNEAHINYIQLLSDISLQKQELLMDIIAEELSHEGQEAATVESYQEEVQKRFQSMIQGLLPA